MARFGSILLSIAACAALAGPAQAVSPSTFSLPDPPAPEAEPNDVIASATPIAASTRLRGSIAPNGDVDIYSFTASAGDRVYAGTMTNASITGNADTSLDLLASDGTTVIESDDNDGSFSGPSSSISGATIPAGGTYYLQVKYFAGSAQLRPYDLYVQVRSGAPVAESENNDLSSPQALPPGGWVSGETSTTSDFDTYSFALNAGDTVFVSLDADPERNGTTWNPRLGLALFGGDALTIDDANVTSPNSEAFFMTVKSSGTYFAIVSQSGLTTGTYNLSVVVVPAQTQSCRVYDSSGSVAIPTGPGMATSDIVVPDDVDIGRAAVQLDVDHASMPDLDISLQTAAGNEIVPLTDVGDAAITHMDVLLDDFAALAAAPFSLIENEVLQPEPLGGHPGWLKGERSGGTWRLVVRDDTAGNGGTLNSWRLVLCEADPLPSGTAIYSNDFEAGDGGFTHSGTLDEWQRGLPTFAPIASCAGGSTGCWKTDLDNTYDASSNQDLISPPIAVDDNPIVSLSWAQRFQMESSIFDHYFVEVSEVAVPGSERRVFEWDGPTMTATVGNPGVTIQESSGWAVVPVDISEFAGKTIQVRFHVDSDTTVNLAGVAIDNVTVVAVNSTPPDTTIDSGPTGTTDDSTPTFTFSSTETASTFECRVVPGGSFAQCSSPHTTAPLAAGDHTFEVRAIDADANPDPTPATRAFTVVQPSNPGGGNPGGGNPGGGIPGDTTAPLLTFGKARAQKLAKTIVIVVAPNEDILAGATGTVAVPTASKVFRLGSVTSMQIGAGTKTRLRLKVPRKARAAIKRALARKQRVKAKIRVTASDTSGNVTTAKRSVRLKR